VFSNSILGCMIAEKGASWLLGCPNPRFAKFAAQMRESKMKAKKPGFGLEIKSFVSEDGDNFIIYRTPDGKNHHGTYHVFQEVSAKLGIILARQGEDDAQCAHRKNF
jgi:hypothetical protein